MSSPHVPSADSDIQALNTRRAWIIDQLSALVRNGAVPKSDAWIQTILDWLAVHGLFVIVAKKKTDKGAAVAGGVVSLATTFPSALFPSSRAPRLVFPRAWTRSSRVLFLDSIASLYVRIASCLGMTWTWARVWAEIAECRLLY